MSAKIVALIADLDGYDFVHRDDDGSTPQLDGKSNTFGVCTHKICHKFQ